MSLQDFFDGKFILPLLSIAGTGQWYVFVVGSDVSCRKHRFFTIDLTLHLHEIHPWRHMISL